jgi:manganese/zinc/iron transport system permease protein
MTLVDALTFRAGYTSSVVALGVLVLGIGSGVVGALALLRKRALMGDALAHATLPGVAGAFLLMVALRAWLEPKGFAHLPEPKSLLVLMIGAAITALLGFGTVHLIRSLARERIPEESAIGIVLSVFFGIGTVLLSVVQNLSSSSGASSAGLKSFIFGQVAAMSAADARLLGFISLCCIILAVALFKEFRLVTFDDAFARVQGWPVGLLDALLMALVVAITVAGLQAVGLVLVVALLIVPAAAARFWTDRLAIMLLLSGAFGGLSGYIGVAISSVAPGLPAGSIVVLVAGAIFLQSAVGAPNSGFIARAVKRSSLAARARREHALRALYELLEAEHKPLTDPIDAQLVHRVLLRIDRRAIRGLLFHKLLKRSGHSFSLTPDGQRACLIAVRNHRLWEHYLVTRAALASTHVDRAADMIEHVLDPAIVKELEGELAVADATPPSVHPIAPVSASMETRR